MTDIAGRVAVVTGGGSGIGRALARALAAEGASVVVADIILGNAQKVAEEIQAAGGRATALACDVCERDSIRQMKGEANAAFGLVTLVIANAGATSFERLTDMSDADVDWILQVNLLGVTDTIRTFLPDIIAAKQGGHILTTASMAGLLPAWMASHATYSAAKMGIIGLTLNLSLELAEHDIGATIYCPGGVASGMLANNPRYRPPRFGGPGEGELRVSKTSFEGKAIAYYTPESIAPMVLRAIHNNRPFVFDHAEQRRIFRETYSDVVEACYDDLVAYEREHGVPAANPTGARLIDAE